MTRYSIAWVVVTAMLGLIWAWTTPLGQPVANAAELKVLASVALESALDALTPVVERTSGGKISTVMD